MESPGRVMGRVAREEYQDQSGQQTWRAVIESVINGGARSPSKHDNLTISGYLYLDAQR